MTPTSSKWFQPVDDSHVTPMSSECLSCLGLAGTPRISPGPPIYVGKYWQVEHAYPSKVVGWLVIALRRHAIALHELTPSEFAELGSVLELTVRALHGALSPAKEYAACYAEARGFEHIHFHVVPRPHDMPEELRGAGSFELLQVSRSEAADPAAVKAFCESLQAVFGRNRPS
jgi:diadenosine tetraphosphate (Ap4A) HIT family hydrolase